MFQCIMSILYLLFLIIPFQQRPQLKLGGRRLYSLTITSQKSMTLGGGSPLMTSSGITPMGQKAMSMVKPSPAQLMQMQVNIGYKSSPGSNSIFYFN